MVVRDSTLVQERAELGRYQALGAAGSAVVVLGGLLAGVLPIGDWLGHFSAVRELRESETLSVLVVYAGLAMLLIAWWRIGRIIQHSSGPSRRALGMTAVWWGTPFALTTPVFSGDVYSYLAQGAMTIAGLDTYRVGPAALGGPLAVNVPEIWQHTPAPYGPVFLGLAGTTVQVTHDGVWTGIVGMRLLAIVGVGLLLWSIPRLAEFCGVRPESAIWLGVLNPLVLLHLIGDAHNDALMLGLMLLGVTLVLQQRAVAGVAAITLGALVKAPAALALAFVIPIWSAQLTGAARWMRAAQRTLGVAAVTALLVTAATGAGFGWVRALDTPTRARTWMSISTDLGFVFGTLGHWLAGFSVDEVRHAFWMVGLVLAAVVTMFLLRHSARIGPLLALGISLTVLVLAGPVVHPWYLLWGIVPLAAAATADRIRRLAAVGSAGMVLLVIPCGVRPGVSAFTGALLGAGSVFLFARLLERLRAATSLPPWQTDSIASGR
jgi:hypothetical protein